MKITDLDSTAPSPSTVLSGVEVDGECFTPPTGLEAIGLVWRGDAPDQIDDTLIDVIIAFGLSGVEVILEIRPEHEVDANYILTVSGNAGFSVAVVPPEPGETPDRELDAESDGDSEGDPDGEAEAWFAQCERFAGALLTTPNFSRTLFPVTGYLTYLVAESFAGAEALDPTDPYTRLRFAEAVSTARSTACKLRMRGAMGGILGGEEALRDYLAAMVRGLYDEAEKHIVEMARDSAREA